MNTNTLSRILLAALLAAIIPNNVQANPGDLYVTDTSSIRIYAPNGTASILASGLLRPRGLAFDGSGNLFVATLDTRLSSITEDRFSNSLRMGQPLFLPPNWTFLKD